MEAQGFRTLHERLLDRVDHRLHHPPEALSAGMDQPTRERVHETDLETGSFA